MMRPAADTSISSFAVTLGGGRRDLRRDRHVRRRVVEHALPRPAGLPGPRLGRAEVLVLGARLQDGRLTVDLLLGRRRVSLHLAEDAGPAVQHMRGVNAQYRSYLGTGRKGRLRLPDGRRLRRLGWPGPGGLRAVLQREDVLHPSAGLRL